MTVDSEALEPCPLCKSEVSLEDPHEVLHVYDGDGGVIIREGGVSISTFGVQSPEVMAAFHAATATPADVARLVEQLAYYVEYFDAIETLPRPVELFYAIKNEGENSGWRYIATGFGPSDIKASLTTLLSLSARCGEMERALEPFSVFAGPLFERNFNKTDVIARVSAADGGVVSITAEHFFDARRAREAWGGE